MFGILSGMSDKAEAFDISSFLAGQVAEGELESEGKFTVSQDDAARKLARFSMPFDYAWVLKVVQAAVAWGCAQIDVRQYRTFSLFTFCPEDTSSLPSEEEFLGVLLTGKMFNSEPLSLLCQALRSLVEQASLSFRLLIDRPGQSGRAIHAGADANGLQAEERLARIVPDKGVRLMVAHLPLERYTFGRFIPKSLLSDRPDLRIAETLRRFCFVCPVPLTLDRRRVDGLLDHPDWGFQFRRRRPVLMGAVNSPEISAWPLPAEFEEKVISINTLPRRAKRSYGGAKCGNIWFYVTGLQLQPGELWEKQLIRAKQISYHQLFLVNHGVVVDAYQTQIRTEHAQLSIFISSKEMPTDLSGFTVSQTEEVEKAVKIATHAVSEELHRLSATPDRFLEDVLDDESSKDKLSYRLARQSHRDAERWLGPDFPTFRKGLAASLFIGRCLTSTEREPVDIKDSLAREWQGAMLRDLDELATVGTAEFREFGWLTAKP